MFYQIFSNVRFLCLTYNHGLVGLHQGRPSPQCRKATFPK